MPQSKISIGELNTTAKNVREYLADLQAILETLSKDNPHSEIHIKMQHDLRYVFEGVGRLMDLAYRATR